MYVPNQIGSGRCSICKSEGTNIRTCPCNPSAKNHDFKKHDKWLDVCPDVKGVEVVKTAEPIITDPNIIRQLILSMNDIKTIMSYCASNKQYKLICATDKEIKNHILNLTKGVKRKDIKDWPAVSYVHGKRIYHAWLDKVLPTQKVKVTVFAPKKEFGKKYTISFSSILKKKPTTVPDRPKKTTSR